MGKAVFFHIADSQAKLQVYLREDHLGKKQFELFSFLDIGDIIAVKGELFKTRTGELTVLVAATNSGIDPADSALPDTVEALVGQLVVPLQRDGPEAEMVVEPGATHLGRYRGTLPEDLEGLVAIELNGLDAGRCYVEVVPAL